MLIRFTHMDAQQLLEVEGCIKCIQISTCIVYSNLVVIDVVKHCYNFLQLSLIGHLYQVLFLHCVQLCLKAYWLKQTITKSNELIAVSSQTVQAFFEAYSFLGVSFKIHYLGLICVPRSKVFLVEILRSFNFDICHFLCCMSRHKQSSGVQPKVTSSNMAACLTGCV